MIQTTQMNFADAAKNVVDFSFPLDQRVELQRTTREDKFRESTAQEKKEEKILLVCFLFINILL
jgi:hypothetical protein